MVFFVEVAKFFQPWSSIISDELKLSFIQQLSWQQLRIAACLGLSSARFGLWHWQRDSQGQVCDFSVAIFLMNNFMNRLTVPLATCTFKEDLCQKTPP